MRNNIAWTLIVVLLLAPVGAPAQHNIRIGSPTVPAVTTVDAATYSTISADDIIHVTYTVTGVVTVTLDTDQVAAGRTFAIKDAGGNANANNITIDTEGGALIDGAADAMIDDNYGYLVLYCDGTDWFEISEESQEPVYATAYQNDLSTVIEIDVAGGFRRVNANVSGGFSGFTTVNDSLVLVDIAGIYKIDYAMGFTLPSNNDEVETGIRKNAAVQAPGRMHVKSSALAAELVVSGHAVFDLAIGDTVSIVLTNTTDTDDVTVEHTNLTMWLLR